MRYVVMSIMSIFLISCSLHGPGPEFLTIGGSSGVVGTAGTVIAAISLPGNIAEVTKRNQKNDKQKRLEKFVRCLNQVNAGGNEKLYLGKEDVTHLLAGEDLNEENDGKRQAMNKCMNDDIKPGNI